MRTLIHLCIVAVLGLSQSAIAQTYPTKAVRLIVPFPPGGSADAAARPIANKLGASLGQPLVVENRGGGLTVIGAEIAAKAAPDGYTLLIMPGTHVLSPYLVKNVPFDPVRDFTPIGMLATIPYVFFSDPKQPFSSMAELIAYARANPGKVSVGTTDALSRLAVESLNKLANIELINVNYKGAGQLAVDVVGQHIQAGVITPPSILGFYHDKRIRALGITGPNRIESMPDVASVAEATGLRDYSIQTWFVLAGPAGLPKPIVAQLQQHIKSIVADASIRKDLVGLGMEPATDTSSERAALLIRTDHERFGPMVKAAGIVAE